MKRELTEIADYIEANSESLKARVNSDNHFGHSIYLKIKTEDGDICDIRISDHSCGAKAKFHNDIYSLEHAERFLYPNRFQWVDILTGEFQTLRLSETEIKEGDEVISRFVSKKGNRAVEVKRPIIIKKYERI